MRAALSLVVATLVVLPIGFTADNRTPLALADPEPPKAEASKATASTPKAESTKADASKQKLSPLPETLPAEMEDLVGPGPAGLLRRDADPKIQLAKSALAEIAKSEQEWKAASERLDKAVSAQAKQFNLFTEAETTAAIDAFSMRLKASGEELLKAYAELTRENIELRGALKRGPAYLREVAALYERYASEEEYEDIKQQYYSIRDIWQARAKLLEQRGASVDSFYDPQFVPYLKQWNRLLDRLHLTLQIHYPFDKANQEEYNRFARQLDEHMKRIKALVDALSKWREAALKQAEDPDIRKEEKERKDSIGAMLSPISVPFARTVRAKEIVLKAGIPGSNRNPRGRLLGRIPDSGEDPRGRLVTGDIVLIVRPRAVYVCVTHNPACWNQPRMS
jgi:hypothetical protein